MAMQALCYRGVSRIEDEPICFGAVLGVDIAKVAAVTPAIGGNEEDHILLRNARMQEVWKQVSDSGRGIDKEFIFNKLPRLTNAGFRWAPAAILQKPSEGFQALFGDLDAEKGTLTPLGLMVAFEGYRIEPGGPSSLTDAATRAFGADGDAKTFFLRDITGTWYNVSVDHEVFSMAAQSLKKAFHDRNKKWYIILRGPRVVSNPTFQTGLLCYQTSHPDDANVYHSLVTLHVSQMRPAFHTLREACYPHALAIRQTRTGRHLQYLMAYQNAFRKFTSWIPWPIKDLLVIVHDKI